MSAAVDWAGSAQAALIPFGGGSSVVGGVEPRLDGSACRATITLDLRHLQHAHHPALQNILGGVSAAAAGLLIATGIRMLLPHRGRPAAVLFAALAFGLMAFGKLPLLFVLLGLAPLSIAVAGITRAR